MKINSVGLQNYNPNSKAKLSPQTIQRVHYDYYACKPNVGTLDRMVEKIAKLGNKNTIIDIGVSRMEGTGSYFRYDGEDIECEDGPFRNLSFSNTIFPGITIDDRWRVRDEETLEKFVNNLSNKTVRKYEQELFKIYAQNNSTFKPLTLVESLINKLEMDINNRGFLMNLLEKAKEMEAARASDNLSKLQINLDAEILDKKIAKKNDEYIRKLVTNG